jgi:hypothetical protein
MDDLPLGEEVRGVHLAHVAKIAAAVALITTLVVPSAQPAAPLTVRQRLVRCQTAVYTLYIGRVEPRQPTVATLNRKVSTIARKRCNGDSRVLGPRAGRALFDLSLGIGIYQQYLVSVAFERPDASLLRQAKNWIARGKKEAKTVLR